MRTRSSLSTRPVNQRFSVSLSYGRFRFPISPGDDRQQEDIDSAVRRVSELLDESLIVDASGHSLARESGTVYKIMQKGKFGI